LRLQKPISRRDDLSTEVPSPELTESRTFFSRAAEVKWDSISCLPRMQTAKPARRDNVDEFLRVANERICTPTPVVRGLLDLRLLIGAASGGTAHDRRRRLRLERRSPGCAIVFYIDAEQQKVCNLHGAQDL
jgi:hypothetical protein